MKPPKLQPSGTKPAPKPVQPAKPALDDNIIIGQTKKETPVKSSPKAVINATSGGAEVLRSSQVEPAKALQKSKIVQLQPTQQKNEQIEDIGDIGKPKTTQNTDGITDMAGLAVGVTRNPRMQAVLSQSSNVKKMLKKEGSLSEVARPESATLITTEVSSKNRTSATQGIDKFRPKSLNRVTLPPAKIGPYSLRNAAAQGNPQAQFAIAMRFVQGKGVTQDYTQAIRWLKRSAAQSFAPAQYHLAALYERGRGISRDIGHAKTWYRRAAVNGNIKAMHNLAVHIHRAL